MKKLVINVTAVGLAFVASSALQTISAQSPADDDDVVYSIGMIELVRPSGETLQLLESARRVQRNSDKTPAFAIRTKNNKFVMSIGGRINPIMGFDIGNNLYKQDGSGVSFVGGNIPVPSLTGHKGDFFINALGSYLDASVVAFGGTSNQLTGYIKIGTNNVSKSILLKDAYISYRGFAAGRIQTLLQDGDAVQPPTIDPQGPGGMVGTTLNEISYRSKSYNGFRFAIGLDLPSFDNSDGYYRGHDYRQLYGQQVDAGVDQLIPDIPAYIEYEGSGNNRIRLSGIYRNFAYQDMISKKRRNVAGYGVQLSGNFSFYKPLVFNFQGIYGEGIASYIQDLQGRPLSFTPKDSDPGKMEANPMMGLVFGASYNATDKLQFNAVYSYTRIWNVADYAVIDDKVVSDANGDKVNQAGDANFRYSNYLAANCFYKIKPYLKWGIEYVYGRRNTWNLGGANDSRIQTMLSFTF